MSIPKNKDGSLNEDQILSIYVIEDENGNPSLVVAITSNGQIIETATNELLKAVNAFKKAVVVISISQLVMRHFYVTGLQELDGAVNAKSSPQPP